MLRVDFNADELPPELLGGGECRAGPGERVKHRSPRRAECGDEGLEGGDRLLRRMQLVPGVRKFDHIGDRLRGRQWLALEKQIRLFVLVTQKARGGRIFLAKDK